jgi:hypothetical protein
MTLYLLVEGKSELALLTTWAKRVVVGLDVRVIPHGGKGKLPSDVTAPPDPKKRGLLDQLPAKLRAYGTSLKGNDGVLVLVDADDDDATSLRARLSALAGVLHFKACVAVEETEAFYFGDLRALKQAFPNADMELARKFEPDSVCGTWERFGQVIGDDGGNKVRWAETIAPYLTTDPSKTRSPSCKEFLEALVDLSATTKTAPAKPRPKRIIPRPRDTQGRR